MGILGALGLIGSVTVIVLFALENLNFQVMREYSLTMFIVQAVLVVLQIPFSITGIVGVAKKNEKCILAFFCYTIISILGSLAYAVCFFVFSSMTGYSSMIYLLITDYCQDPDTGTVDEFCYEQTKIDVLVALIVAGVIQVIFVALWIYWGVEIFRFYRILRREKREGKEAIPA